MDVTEHRQVAFYFSDSCCFSVVKSKSSGSEVKVVKCEENQSDESVFQNGEYQCNHW